MRATLSSFRVLAQNLAGDETPPAVLLLIAVVVDAPQLLLMPVLLSLLLMFSRVPAGPGAALKVAAVAALLFMVSLFYRMVRTRRTYRWRPAFFAALGLLFPVGFIWELIQVRGSMSIPIEEMIAGNTPFCLLAIPTVIVPAALFRVVIFPGSILPASSNPHAAGAMVALSLAATLVIAKGWHSFGCFFGGIMEGFAAAAGEPRIRKLNAYWRLAPWSVSAAIALVSAATFEPTYCRWLCRFKTLTEYPEVRSVETAMRAGIFTSLFGGPVIVMPLLTERRMQCTFLCPSSRGYWFPSCSTCSRAQWQPRVSVARLLTQGKRQATRWIGIPTGLSSTGRSAKPCHSSGSNLSYRLPGRRFQLCRSMLPIRPASTTTAGPTPW